MSDSGLQPVSSSVSHLSVQPDSPSMFSLSLLPESPSVSTLRGQYDSSSFSDQSITPAVTQSISGGSWSTPMTLGMVSGHQRAQSCKGCQHKVQLLNLRRVNKRLRWKLATMKTTVSELKSVSAKTCILLPKVIVSFPLRPRNTTLSITNRRPNMSMTQMMMTLNSPVVKTH